MMGLGASLQERLMDRVGGGFNGTGEADEGDGEGEGEGEDAGEGAGGGAGVGAKRGSTESRLAKTKRQRTSQRTSPRNFQVVMLEANYRSHRELLKIPSKMFYNNRLTENADR